LLLFSSCRKKEDDSTPIVSVPSKTTIEGMVINSYNNQPVPNMPVYLAVTKKGGGNVISYSFDEKDTLRIFVPVSITDANGKFKISFDAKDAYEYSFYATKWTAWASCNSLWECGTNQWNSCDGKFQEMVFQRGAENKNKILKIDPTEVV
jgi:hypothetical protein